MTEEINEDEIETVNEQSHKVEVVYSDPSDMKKKRAVMSINAKSKSMAINKVGSHLSKSGCKVHSIVHKEAVDLDGDTLEEGKTYRTDSDHSFSSKIRNNAKKKADKAAKARATDKRSVDEE